MTLRAISKDAKRSNKILVTDSLFIFDEHMRRMQDAGFEVERLDKLTASKEEMIAALKDKQGYVCGGLEKIDAEVIKTATGLKAVAVLASGYTEFLPSYQEATKQGIAIASCPGANSRAVAEYSLLLILASIRNFAELIRPGGVTFATGRELPSLTLGIVGFGHIGQELARMALVLGMKVQAHSRHAETIPGVKLVGLSELLATSDVVSLNVNKIHGAGVLGAAELAMMKNGATLVNCTFHEVVDQGALYAELVSGRLKFAADEPPMFVVSDVPAGNLIYSNASNAFNTQETLQRMSDRATNSIINLLKTGDDPDLVNPEYRQYLKNTN